MDMTLTYLRLPLEIHGAEIARPRQFPIQVYLLLSNARSRAGNRIERGELRESDRVSPDAAIRGAVRDRPAAGLEPAAMVHSPLYRIGDDVLLPHSP